MAENEEIKNEDTVQETDESTASTDDAVKTETGKETGSEITAKIQPEIKPEKDKRSHNPFRNKKFRHGTLSIVFTIIFIAAIVMVNVILNLVLDRFKVEVDLTTNQIYTLSPETEDYIRGLGDDIEIYVTAEEETLRSSGEKLYEQIVEFLEKMQSMNSHIKVKYVNLLTDPDFSKDYVETLQNYQMIIKSAGTQRYRILSINDFLRFTLSDGNTYSYSEANMYVTYGGYTVVDYSSNAEEQLVSAMMTVSKENPTVVTFLTGYGENDSSALQKILTDNAYEIKSTDIEQVAAVPEETDILVIFAPSKDYSNESVTKVDEWLSNNGKYGKNLVYVASADAVETPNLDEFLKEWGLEIGNGYIMQMDPDYAYNTGYPMPVMHALELNEDTDYYSNMKLSSSSRFMGYFVRPVIKLWDEESNFANKVIASATGTQCVLYPFDADENFSVSADDYRGYDVIVEASKVQFENNSPVYSKVIAVGSDLMFIQNFTSASNYSNGEVALALFDANSDNESGSIKVVSKSFKAETYQLESSQQTAIGLIFAVFIPIIIIVVGIIVWARRRRL